MKKNKSANRKASKTKKQTFYMLEYEIFPHSLKINVELEAVIECFKKNYDAIKSPKNKLNSNDVLKIISADLKAIGFKVEDSKAEKDKIKVPVLFDENNKILKSFDADAISIDEKILLEVEAGGAFANHKFLKDVFQACMMPSVDYLMIAVRNVYGKKKITKDYSEIYKFFETLYVNERLQLPLKGIVLIGY